MNEKYNLITPENIQGELIKNEIELNNLRIQAFKEQKYNELLRENKQLKDKINKAINDIDLVIELITQQPTEDDGWILDRLNAFKIILKEVK